VADAGLRVAVEGSASGDGVEFVREAERLGADPERDPYPGMLAVLASGMFRNSLGYWASSGGSVPLEQLIDLAFQALVDGLPETTPLRHALSGVTDRKESH